MALEPGQVLQDRYHIDALLGQGGMEAVYRATDLRFGAPVLRELGEPVGENIGVDQVAVAFSPDGCLLAWTHFDIIELWAVPGE